MPCRKSAIAILKSPFPRSSSEKIVRLIFDELSKPDWTNPIIDLSNLPSDALLLRSKDKRDDDAIEITNNADLLVLTTQIHKATYTGLLKVFLDQAPNEALKSAVVLPR